MNLDDGTTLTFPWPKQWVKPGVLNQEPAPAPRHLVHGEPCRPWTLRVAQDPILACGAGPMVKCFELTGGKK